jgi:hypothetical protein
MASAGRAYDDSQVGHESPSPPRSGRASRGVSRGSDKRSREAGSGPRADASRGMLRRRHALHQPLHARYTHNKCNGGNNGLRDLPLLNKKTNTTRVRMTDSEPYCGARIDTRTIPIDVRTPRQIGCDRWQRSEALRHYAAFTLEEQTAEAEYIATKWKPPRSRRRAVHRPNIAQGRH